MGTFKETSNNDESAQKDESTSNCEEQKFIEIETTCKRPEFLGVQEANGLLA